MTEPDLGVKFNDPGLLTTALTHRSYLNENPSVNESNERLEFLGDSVLQLLSSDHFYRQYPSFPEGKLTNLRASLVRAKTLASASQQIGLGKFLLMSRGEEKSGGRNNPSLLANAFEAIVGAIYLDQGLQAVTNFLDRTLFSPAILAPAEENLYDFKSKLQEVVQEKVRSSPTYKVLEASGPDHSKTFTVGVYIKKKLVARALGRSKQEAEEKAAQIALKTIE